jgi:trimeric autotransporter adhesin
MRKLFFLLTFCAGILTAQAQTFTSGLTTTGSGATANTRLGGTSALLANTNLELGTFNFNLNNGKVGIGVAAPLSLLHIKAGTATVAPLIFTTGINLTTPIAGAIEYDGTNLTFTPTTVLGRKTIVFSDLSNLSGVIPIAKGGTGAAALATGYVKSNGTVLSTVATVAGADVSGNITGSAANVTGIVPLLNGGTGVAAATNVAALAALLPAQSAATNGMVLRSNGLATNATTWVTATGAGTVTGVSVQTLNGFTGTTTATATPVITIALAPTSTGLLKGTAGVISSAVAGTDYLTPTGSAAGLTTFPTLNQNTTGTASTITGAIVQSQVTNLTTDLAAKQANLVSGTNVKTVNGTSILGAGNLVITATETDPIVKAVTGLVKSNGTTISAATAGIDYLTPTGSAAGLTTFPTLNQNTTGTASTITGAIVQSQVTNLTTDLAAKQANLVSGTNVKTVNGTSILGAGNLVITATETDPIVKAINGLVKSNGTTISAATAGTDYLTPTGSAAGLTGFPTLNQNTTGTAASITGAITQSQVTNLTTVLATKQDNILLTTNGINGPASLVGSTLNIPNYIQNGNINLAQENTSFGQGSLYSNTTGLHNTAFGSNTLVSNTSGGYNTANGTNALYSNTTGFENTANGASALQNNTSGGFNSANGSFSLYANTTGYGNTANGLYALNGNTIGNENTANGIGALYANINGNANTADGTNALRLNQGGSRNIALGDSAGFFNTNGSNQLFINSIPRFNYLEDTTLSILYGQQTNSIATQRLKINGQLQINNGTQGIGKILTSDADGLANWANAPAAQTNYWTATGNDVSNNNTGNVVINTNITSPGSGAGSEHFGKSSSTGTATNATAIGNSATANAVGAVAVGNAVNAGFAGAVVVGSNLSTSAANTVTIGNTITNTGSVAIGSNINTSASVAVGYNLIGAAVNMGSNNTAGSANNAATNYYTSMLIGTGLAATAQRELRIGSGNAGWWPTDIYLSGATANSLASAYGSQTFHAISGFGTNIAGQGMTFKAGKSTGNANGGVISFFTTASGAAGAAENTELERMRLAANGNVGIGTTAPDTTLHLVGKFKYQDGSQATGKVLTSDANGLASWAPAPAAITTAWGLQGNAGTDTLINFIGTTDAKNLIFKTNNTIGATLSFGNVYGKTFKINGATNSDAFLSTESPNATLALGQYGSYTTLSADGRLTLGADRIFRLKGNTTSQDNIVLTRCGACGPGNIISARIDENGTDLFTVNSSGNVGVGIATPTAKLDIAGNIKITDGTQGLNKVLTSDANGLASWAAAPSATSTAWGLQGNTGTNSTANFIGTTDLKDLIFKTNNSERLKLTSGGKTRFFHNTWNTSINNLFSIGDSTFNVFDISTSTASADGQSTIFKFRGNNAGYNDTWSFNIEQGYNTKFNSGAYADYQSFNFAGSEKMRINQFGNVGIGTATPTTRLDIAGAIKIVDGTQGLNKVLTSDANGLATWAALPTVTNTGWGLTGNTGTTAAANFIGTTDNNALTIKLNNAAYGTFNHISHNNILGASAGLSATSISHSNFFGNSAGAGAIAAIGSNFLGYQAGSGATTSSYSNFLGYTAGISASSSANSNFIGYYAGRLANSSPSSNFIGNSAGVSAVASSNSNFFGTNAGLNANLTPYSNFIGFNAGNGANGSTYSNLLGYNVGKRNVNSSIGSNNIIIGTNITLPNAATNAMNLGGVLYGTGLQNDVAATNPYETAKAGGKIGIGVVAPAYTLDVNGITNTLGLIMPTGAAAGLVLTSDATGTAAWAAPSTSGLATANNGLTTSGSNIKLGGNLLENTSINIPTNNSLQITTNNTNTTYGNANSKIHLGANYTNHFGSNNIQNWSLVNIYENYNANGANPAFLSLSTPNINSANGFMFYNYGDGNSVYPTLVTRSNFRRYGVNIGYVHVVNVRDDSDLIGSSGFLLKVVKNNDSSSFAGNGLVEHTDLFSVVNQNTLKLALSNTGNLLLPHYPNNAAMDSVLTTDTSGNLKLKYFVGGAGGVDNSKWTLVGNNIYSRDSANVGIGVNNATAKLHTKGTIRFESLKNNAAKDSVLTTDSSGNLSMKYLSADNSKWRLNGNNIYSRDSAYVGIGTDSATDKFHVFGSMRFQSFKNNAQGDSVLTTDTSGRLKMVYLPYGSGGGGGGATYTFKNGVTQSNGIVNIGGALEDSVNLNLAGYAFNINNGTQKVLTTSSINNNIGVGTSPVAEYRMSVNGDANIGNTTSAIGIGNKLWFNGAGNGDNIWMSRFNTAASNTDLRMNIGNGAGISNDRLDVGYDSANNWNSKFVVQNNGMVGIGTNQLNGLLSVGSTHGNKLAVGNSAWSKTAIINTGNNANADGDYTDLLVAGQNNNNAVLRMNSKGNVGIGTSINAALDSMYRLSVNGKIRAKGLRVQTTGWADFVFDPGYKLKSLIEVEAFINKNKHLPEMLPAKEVIAEGNDVGETQVKLLQKVEELTLYLIDQDKQLKKLQEQNKALETQNKEIENLKKQMDELKALMQKGR